VKIALLTVTRGTVSGGYAKYLQEVVPRMAVHPDVAELRVYVPREMAGRSALYRPWTNLGDLRREVVEWKPDVAFIPNFVTLDLGTIPVVTMVQNMEPLERPFAGNAPLEALRNVARRAAARQGCRRARRIIAVSNHVRDFLVASWRIDPERIGVVYHGVDLPAERRRPAGWPDGVPPSEVLFTAGSIRPARGLEDLAGLPRLIAIAGGVDPGAERYGRRMKRAIDRAVWLGRLTAAEMAWCYANAGLFVMTSRAEACPNIVLESLAHGSLCVSTNKAPMPEFYRDAAIYYRGGDRRDLARAVGEALSLGPDAANDLRARARARADDFTWDATTEATVRELRRATG
jgi:glycosyltransferase involved in cell wall biosynthesis